MKKEGTGEGSSIRSISGAVYKAIGFQISELKARLLGVRNESWSIVVFEKGAVTEVVV